MKIFGETSIRITLALAICMLSSAANADAFSGVQSRAMPTFLVDPTTGLPYAASSSGGGGGTVAIDQTTPGTTDSVTVKAASGIGSLIETAPATDTASSGLNGRLQRIAQRITSLIALVPSALTSGGNFKVAINEVRAKTVTTLLNAVTADGTSSAVAFGSGRKWIQASIAGTGAVAATVTCYGNNANAASGGVLLATMTLTGTTTDTEGADIPAEPAYMYCAAASITGTGAAVTVTIGI
jgi:hypothetical protein